MRSATLSFFIAGPLVASEAKSYNSNTDNKGKLFVTLFAFAPAPKTNS
jgi:hypothetical protein